MKHSLTTSFVLLLTFFLACTSPQPTSENSNFGGLALYTLRDTMSVSPKEVLKEVHDVGYQYVEAAGYNEGTFYGMTPVDFKTYMDEIGLEPVSTHMSMVTLENADQLIADSRAAGFTYFVVPIPPMGMFTYNNETNSMGMNGTMQDFADILNTLGQKASEAGLQLLYHNHDFEFVPNEDGIVPIDYLLENTNPEYVNFQMDLYWVAKAGADAVAYIEQYPGRFKSWHVKDMDTEGRFAPVNNGTIDFAGILQHKETSGLTHYFVEQDRTFNHTPMEVIRISHEGLSDIGFE